MIPSAEYTGTVEVNSALAAIGSQCALWQEQSAYLNWTDYRNTEAMVSNSTGGNLWLGGFWNMGDPSCTNGLRAMENAECIYMMTAILNQCDLGSTNKQGGYMINNCILWAMAVYE
jgi:hypothetical protein